MIIKNVYMIDPSSETEGLRDILIEDGKIARIAGACELSSDAQENSDGTQIIDGTGLIAAPGLVDVHVHFRDPGFEYKEDIYTGAKAAAAGGFTTVVMMANTKPAIDNSDTLKYVIQKGKETDINVYTCANVTVGLKGTELTDMQKLADEGAVGFTDDGIPLRDPDITKQAMEKAAMVGMPLSFHEEDPQYITNNGVNAGPAAEHFGIKGSPRMAEISLIERDCKIAENIDVDIVIQHISSKEGVEIVRKARMNNKHIHAEVTPHHFTLTDEAVIQKGTLAKMNPPLRTEEDRQALIAGLIDGTIDLISTDHAPHSAEEKSKPITDAPSGIIGLETSLALGIKSLVKSGHLTMMELLRKMTVNPASLYKLNAGRIYEGGPADLVIFDRDGEWKVPDSFKSKSTNTPFIGEILPGKIKMTICAGRIVYENE